MTNNNINVCHHYEYNKCCCYYKLNYLTVIISVVIFKTRQFIINSIAIEVRPFIGVPLHTIRKLQCYCSFINASLDNSEFTNNMPHCHDILYDNHCRNIIICNNHTNSFGLCHVSLLSPEIRNL